ncbi:hypothetical protein CF392_10815 [Tamilnaduibacter salinus]|uniref:Phosphoserine phosphatase n=1 Tax=Tamilnaduibacter salinus TaxID=1484056 RepID=A0A2A2I1J3_9GAMM|nr:hypothetical protein CF392_10815 [Tamilnaduibacter salinus]
MPKPADSGSRVLICDLDGTLLAVNSFKVWVLYWLFWGWLRPGFFLAWSRPIVLRLIGQLNRWEMKVALLDSYCAFESQLPDVLRRGFPRFVFLFRRRRLCRVLLGYPYQFQTRILATAAPRLYADAVARSFGIKAVVASDRERGVWVETMGEEKWRTVRSLWEGNGSMPECCLVTDHYEDLPLSMRCRVTMLVRPNKITLQRFEEAGITPLEWPQGIRRFLEDSIE